MIRVIHHSERIELQVDEDGVIRYGKKLWIPDEDGLRKKILKEAHPFPYSIHPGNMTIYQDLKQHFWWKGLEKDVAEYVSKCLTCQQLIIEHQRLSGELQPLNPPEWKWESVTMDFVLALP